jgi:hypothetical protein
MFTRQADGQPMCPQEFGLGGMTLRDYFAGQALAAFIAAPMGKYAHQSTLVHIATDSYGSADAMLAARERKGGAA